jgi:hypothetical protein
MKTKTRIILLAAVVSFVSITAGLLILDRSLSSAESPIPGITKEQLSLMGLNLSLASDTPAVASIEAIRVATHSGAGPKALDATLVRLSGKYDPSGAGSDLVWAVRLDPETYRTERMGKPPPEGRTWPPTRTTVALRFVNAETGEEMFTSSLFGWAEPTPDWLPEYVD